MTYDDLMEMARLRGVIDSLEEEVDKVLLNEGTQQQKWAQIGSMYCSIRHLLQPTNWDKDDEGVKHD